MELPRQRDAVLELQRGVPHARVATRPEAAHCQALGFSKFSGPSPSMHLELRADVGFVLALGFSEL